MVREQMPLISLWLLWYSLICVRKMSLQEAKKVFGKFPTFDDFSNCFLEIDALTLLKTYHAMQYAF